MRPIEIGVINPRDERQALRKWAARVDAGEIMPNAESQLGFATYSQLHSALTNKRMESLECVAQHEGMNIRKLAGPLCTGPNYALLAHYWHGRLFSA